MRVSIVNCVSTAAEMMAFSDFSLFNEAGCLDFDYIVVKWLPSLEVDQYLKLLSNRELHLSPWPDSVSVHIIEHQTDDSVGYVPNLRSMMNEGFSRGFQLNDYCGLVNTDCYFGPDWLAALKKYAQSNRVINSLHITPAIPPRGVLGIVTDDLGIPLPSEFDKHRFDTICAELYQDKLITAPKNDYRQCATMPYLFHRKYWKTCGPWELNCVQGEPPDVRFFTRIAEAGAEYCMTPSSIVYHAEAVERRGQRPPGAEHLREET